MKEKYINLFTDSGFKKAFDEEASSLFERASIARFQPEERQAYESNLKYYRDLKNVIDTARDEGREEERRNMLFNLLQRKFGPLSDETAFRLQQANADQLLLWTENIIFADSLESVFTSPTED